MRGLGPSLGRPSKIAKPLLQLGQLLIDQGGGPMGGQLSLLGLDDPANQGGRGLRSLVCRPADTLDQPMGPLQQRVSFVVGAVLGTLIAVCARSAAVRNRSWAAATRSCLAESRSSAAAARSTAAAR